MSDIRRLLDDKAATLKNLLIKGHRKSFLTSRQRDEKEAAEDLLKWLSDTSVKKISAKAWSIKRSKTNVLDNLVKQNKRNSSMDKIFESENENTLSHHRMTSSFYGDSEIVPDDKAGLEAFMLIHSDNKLLEINEHEDDSKEQIKYLKQMSEKYLKAHNMVK